MSVDRNQRILDTVKIECVTDPYDKRKPTDRKDKKWQKEKQKKS